MATKVMLSPATTMNAIVNEVMIMSFSASARCLHQVSDFDARKIGGRIHRDTHRLGFACLFQKRAHLSRIGPVVGARALGDPWLDPGRKILRQREMLLGGHAAEDFAEVVGVVAGKVDRLGVAGGETRASVDETTALVWIAR